MTDHDPLANAGFKQDVLEAFTLQAGAIFEGLAHGTLPDAQDLGGTPADGRKGFTWKEISRTEFE